MSSLEFTTLENYHWNHLSSEIYIKILFIHSVTLKGFIADLGLYYKSTGELCEELQEQLMRFELVNHLTPYTND